MIFARIDLLIILLNCIYLFEQELYIRVIKYINNVPIVHKNISIGFN